MNIKEIQALLLKYQNGQCSEEEVAKIHYWYENLHEDSTSGLSGAERENMESRILDHLMAEIREDKLQETKPVRSLWQRAAPYLSAAAVIIAICGYVFFGKTALNPVAKSEQILVQAPADQLFTQQNHSSITRKIMLEDGSAVTLTPGSKIIYPKKFPKDKREVQLMGDAFFEITKNPDKPFFVYSGKLVTRVLGTSFRIKTNSEGQALEVEVVTGKVSVFENDDSFAEKSPDHQSNGVVLTPNQRVTYFPESRHLMTGLVVAPVKASINADESRLVFNNIVMGSIVEALHKTYGIEIVFANDRLAECTFTGDITDLPLYEKLDLVCGSIGADYEIKGTRILINGRGCE
ncbi:FecR family protein [Dyadobacter chenwenxiniae]|uniref:FecR family protein n=1 Tax=Dyadobacter chenwenxiniae TaxID=2906456 RepID=A0A9X1PMB6_9BACT|nr:FecR family protein [Dyadobacter chenwenxiniae]MCF0062594.1 FecR family protein [Dyadobacter chenwenxiniae]UON83659.1 FecR family protein [Dyadobacter chenwenxiniae]